MTSTPAKHVVFDVVGTCVSYQKLFDTLEERFGEKFRAEGIKSKLLGYAWLEAAEREYTYLSLSGRYIAFKGVFKALFHRMLWMAGVEEPRKFATDEDVEYLMEQWAKLEARPGLAECFAKLRGAGFTVWALTAGDLERVGGYFKLNGVDMPAENLASCDSIGIGKPCPDAYKPMLEKFKKGDEVWFAAAHMWDTSAAMSVGFKGAWCSVWEKEPCLELFETPHVMADTLPEMADKIIAAASKQ